MTALTPTDAASCRAMALECGRRANKFFAKGMTSSAMREIERARDLTLLGLKFEIESEGPKSRLGDAAASLTQQSSSPRQERPSAQERSSDRSGGQFGDAPKPAHIPGTEVQP